jgi:hypothetical protein
MYHLLKQSVTLQFVFMGFVWVIISADSDYFLNTNNHLFFEMEGFFSFQLRNEFLNIVYTSFENKAENGLNVRDRDVWEIFESHSRITWPDTVWLSICGLF